jgi:hypothetical protein
MKNVDGKERQLQDAQANVALLQKKLEEGAAIQGRSEERIANLTVSVEIPLGLGINSWEVGETAARGQAQQCSAT